VSDAGSRSLEGGARHGQSGCRSLGVRSGRDRDQAKRCAEAVLDAAAQDEKAGVLASVERVRRYGSGSKAESVWLIVISCAIAVQGAWS
jgi:hypothetical protein